MCKFCYLIIEEKIFIGRRLWHSSACFLGEVIIKLMKLRNSQTDFLVIEVEGGLA